MIRSSMHRWPVLVLVGMLGACASSGTRGTTTESGGAIADTSSRARTDTAGGAIDTSARAMPPDSSGANAGVSPAPSADSAAAGAGASWTATLTPVGGNSIAGTATGSGNTVTLQITGSRGGVPSPWMIYEGTCTNRIAPVGTPNDYPPVQTSADGSGTATAKLSSPLDPSKTYVVVVQVTPAGSPNDIAACGNVQMSGK